jgi:hypothetical protein
MSAARSLQAGLRDLARRPADVAPHYFLAVGIGFAARTPLFVGLGIALALLQAQGRIEPVVEALDGFDIAAGDGAGDAPAQVPPELSRAVEGLLTPGVAAVVVASALVAVVLFVLARGIGAAGTLTAQAEALGVRHGRGTGDDRTPLVAGVAGIGDDWRAFTALALVRTVVVSVGAVAAVFGLGLTLTGIGALVGLPVLLLTLVVGGGLTLLLAFAGQAVAVDGEGALGALGAAGRFAVRKPLSFLLYALIALAVLVGSIALAASLSFLGVGRLSGVVGAFLLTPVLDTVRTALYAGEAVEADGETTADPAADPWAGTGFQQARLAHTAEEPAADPTGNEESEEEESGALAGMVAFVRGGLANGLSALGEFLRERPLLNLGGTATLLVGVWLGWRLTSPYGAQVTPPADVAGVFGAVAVGPFLNIAANNWLVALSQGFGGVAFGVPSVVNLLFNGVLVGALAGVYDVPTFLALVVPHAVIEVPALGVAGALGVHLGGVGYRALRGRLSRDAIAAELRRATRIVVGLLPVFVLASFVEAFLTPRIAAFVLGA